jgi:hypothetical protein
VIRAIRRVGMLALVASALSGMYLFRQHHSAPAANVTLSAELAVVAPEDQVRRSVVPRTQAALLHAAVAKSALARDFPEQVAEVLEGTGFVRSPNGFTANAPEPHVARGL